MAELYLKQGHPQDALRVYQALLAQRPSDARLKSKVEKLSSGGRKKSGVSAQDFLKGIWSGRGVAPPAPEEQSTLSAAFDVAGPTPGEPSHPAHDHISLDSVFGEEAGKRTNSPPTDAAPSVPSSEASAATAGGSKTGGFSFDEFFAGGRPAAAGGAADGAAEAASAKTPGGSRSSGRTQRPPEDEVEADQFQQWLKKLKS